MSETITKELQATTAKLGEIYTDSNPRKDFGNILELAESIRQKGLLNPLTVRKKKKGMKKYELVAGERRYRALLTLAEEKPVTGMDIEVRVTIIDEAPEGVEELKLLENIQRKDLTPMEEAKAFSSYMKRTKRNAETLAQNIGKSKGYVERRARMVGLSKKCADAIDQGRIEVGHADLLSQLSQVQQDVCLNEIEGRDYTVQQFADMLRFNPSIDFEDLPFRQGERHSVGQTVLTDVGAELNPKGNLNDKIVSKMKKELAVYLEAEREKLRKKGITVFASQAKLMQKHKKAEQVSQYGYDNPYDYSKVLKELPGSKEFALVVTFDYRIEKEVYCLDGEAYRAALKEKQAEKKGKAKKQQQTKMTEKQRAEQEKMLEMSRSEKLQNRVREHMHKFRIGKTAELLQSGTVVSKAVALDALMDELGYGEEGKEDLQREIYKAAKKKYSDYGDTRVNVYLLLTAKQLDTFIHKAGQLYVRKRSDKWLGFVQQAAGLDYSKHWIIGEDFLNLHTKAQLLDLAKEVGISKESLEEMRSMKKDELVQDFADHNLKGKVPKILKKI